MSDSERVRFPAEAEKARASWDRRVRLAKEIETEAAKLANGILVPPEVRAFVAKAAALLRELADLSHAKFDQSPFDLGRMQHQLDELRGLKGRDKEQYPDG